MACFPSRLLLAFLLLTGPAWAQDRTARLDAMAARLRRAASATQFLADRCAALRLAEPATVHAQTVPARGAVTARIRALLKAGAAEPIRHRHVRLTCGGQLLSEADNWYVPSRLTPAMNRMLDTSDTPFGAVVRPLDFHRRTVASAHPAGGAAVLRVTAVLLTPRDVPISLVVENYSRLLLAP